LKGATKKEAAFWTVFIQRVQVRVGLKRKEGAKGA